jgi:hypothetical protein
MKISVGVEGLSDQGAAAAIIRSCGLSVGAYYGNHGKHALLKKLNGYNAAANYSPWLILVDLDNDGPCPGAKRSEWLANPSNLMCFRIAVREIEAWLLADTEKISEFLHIPEAIVPLDPESLPDPKATLVSLARRSRSRDIREGLVPRNGSGVSVGPTYASDLNNFGRSEWRPDIAADSAPNLKKCILRVQELAERISRSGNP